MKKIQQLFAFTIFALIASCSNDEDAPASTNPEPNVLTVTTATPILTPGIVKLGGEVTKDGGKTVTERGVCVGETANPVITNTDNVIEPNGTGLGVFTSDFDISEAPAGAVFHYRAYAKNADGTAYGENKTITIPAAETCNVVNVNPNNVDVTISTPTTWTAGNVYIITKTLYISAPLTIQPGTVIKLNSGTILVNNDSGKIIANGTATNRIVFTSYADDSACGDTNGDGNATTPQKGDWFYLRLNNGTDHSFKYCDFLYAGKSSGGSNNCITVTASGNQFTFDNCVFAHCKNGSSSGSQGSSVISGGENINDASISVFTNNAIYDCDKPMYVSHGYTVNTNNIFHNPNNPNEKNLRNGIYMFGYGFGLNTVTWGVTEVPYVIEFYAQYSGSKTVNIPANVVVKFPSSSYGISYQINTLNLSSSAILTSIKDDSVGGDTNGDGNASSPASGDWYGLYRNYSPSGFVNNANIRYAAN